MRQSNMDEYLEGILKSEERKQRDHEAFIETLTEADLLDEAKAIIVQGLQHLSSFGDTSLMPRRGQGKFNRVQYTNAMKQACEDFMINCGKYLAQAQNSEE